MAQRGGLVKRRHLGDEIDDSSYGTDTTEPNSKRLKIDTAIETSEDDLSTHLHKEFERRAIGEKNNRMTLPEQVMATWAPRYTHEFYTACKWYDRAWDRTCLLNDYLRIMSILICIGFPHWDDFKKIFIDRQRTDKNLPFQLEDLRRKDFLGHTFGTSFRDKQRCFCRPRTIIQRQKPIHLKEGDQLPCVGQFKDIGHGAFGEVRKNYIAKGYLMYKNRSLNSTDTAVAVKSISDRTVRKLELRNLRELRSCLSEHKCIMVNIATIIEKSETATNKIYHLLYDVAAFDLGVFLTNYPTQQRALRKEAGRDGRNDSLNMEAADLFEASSNLADALDFIHNRLHNPEGRISLAHNDIKPENILVVYPDSTDPDHTYPAGLWKLTDFGLSRVKDPHKPTADFLSAEPFPIITERTHRLKPSASVSKSFPKRPPGTYTAPELDQTGKDPERMDGRRADRWSFGCVLSEVVAYAVQMDPSLVQELQNIVTIRFYDVETKKLHSGFQNFLEKLPEKAPVNDREPNSSAWITSCTELIRDIVVAEPPDKRLGPGAIRDKLWDITHSIRPYKRSRFHHDLSRIDTNMENGNWSSSPESESPIELEDQPQTSSVVLSSTDSKSENGDSPRKVRRRPTITLTPAAESSGSS
ncbi:hypothetical protein NX059_009681 [Plenodomus lindquistii]|nr:hypothetical protein NX059_009681 [Plenodomus lindquistii]